MDQPSSYTSSTPFTYVHPTSPLPTICLALAVSLLRPCTPLPQLRL